MREGRAASTGSPPPSAGTSAVASAPGWTLSLTRRVKAKVRDPLWIIPSVAWLVCIVILVWFAALIYQLRIELAVLQHAQASHLKERVVIDERWRAEFDEVYKTLYNPPAPAPETRKPSAVELWQVNRDKELRARIQRLEAWRLSQH